MECTGNENWEAAERRFAAFWEREVTDRPCLQIRVRDAGAVLHLCEAFPIAYIQQGGLAAMMGCRQVADAQTVWTKPLEVPIEPADIRVDPESPVLKRMVRDFEEAGLEAKGKHLVSLPADMGSVGDTLAKMLGYENVCAALADDPDRVAEFERRIADCWERLYDLFYALLQPCVPGSSTMWLPIYCAGRCTLVEADFVTMISPEHFERVYLPAIRRRIAAVERSMFHLDGPGCARHLDRLLDIVELDGIQWEPGAGAASADRIRWLPMLKKIQSAGKRLWVACAVREVETMLRELDPRGLILSVTDCQSVETARRIEALARQRLQ